MNFFWFNPFIYLKILKNQFRKSIYLYKTKAPIFLYWSLLICQFKNLSILLKYRRATQKSIELKNELKLSADWFTDNIPYWSHIFDCMQLRNKNIKILEIGSWEGLSSYYFMHFLEQAHLTCVDTWEGADEHKDGTSATIQQLGMIESNFDSNLKLFSGRYSKFKGTSYSFFDKTQELKEQYELIYVDGSHYSEDVLIDAIKSFQTLNTNGIMIFDDYYWQYYKNIRKNPALGINLFLTLIDGEFEVISFYHQLVIKKIKLKS